MFGMIETECGMVMHKGHSQACRVSHRRHAMHVGSRVEANQMKSTSDRDFHANVMLADLQY